MVDFDKLRKEDPEERKKKTDEFIEEHNKKLDKRIQKALNIESGLTDWEISFLESVAVQYEFKGFLSDKQWGIIEKIIEEKG